MRQEEEWKRKCDMLNEIRSVFGDVRHHLEYAESWFSNIESPKFHLKGKKKALKRLRKLKDYVEKNHDRIWEEVDAMDDKREAV